MRTIPYIKYDLCGESEDCLLITDHGNSMSIHMADREGGFCVDVTLIQAERLMGKLQQCLNADIRGEGEKKGEGKS
jgi:hypothetical protein